MSPISGSPISRLRLYRCGTDCAKRCEESEELCQKRLGGVQEAALNAARELWEEQLDAPNGCGELETWRLATNHQGSDQRSDCLTTTYYKQCS